MVQSNPATTTWECSSVVQVFAIRTCFGCYMQGGYSYWFLVTFIGPFLVCFHDYEDVKQFHKLEGWNIYSVHVAAQLSAFFSTMRFFEIMYSVTSFHKCNTGYVFFES